MRWTFYINSIQVYPMNTRDIKIRPTLENEFIYAYRKKSIEVALQNRVDIHSTCYDYIKTLEATQRHAKFTFNIYDNHVIDSTYEFTINDCSFDDYKDTVTIKMTIRDSYTEIQENEDVEVNVVDGLTSYPLSIEKYSYFCFKVVWLSIYNVTFEDSYGTTMTLPNGRMRLLKSVYDHYDSASKYYFYTVFGYSERIEMTAEQYEFAGLTGWTLLAELDDYNVYERLPSVFTPFNTPGNVAWKFQSDFSTYESEIENNKSYYNVITFTEVYSQLGLADFNQYRIDPTTIDDRAFNVYVIKSIYDNRANFVYSFNYRSYLLSDVLNKIISESNQEFGGVIKSSLLFNDSAETGRVLPYGYPRSLYTKVLVDIYDFKLPTASQPTTKSLLTLNKIINYLCYKHNAKWHIDSDGNFRIEHISYYTRNNTLNISNQTHRRYSYRNNDKPNREYFEETIGWNQDFGKITILYGTVPAINGTKENTKSTQMSDLYTDVDGLNSHLGDLPNEGFVYLDTLNGAVKKETGFNSKISNIQNATLSNANCLYYYYRHNAYQDVFYISDNPVGAETLRRMKIQEVEFTHNEIPDYNNSNLQTMIGVGQIEYIEYPLTEEFKFKAEVIYE